MSGDLDFDPLEFVWAYPLWIGACGGNPDDGVMCTRLVSGEICLMVFTDEDLAERYVTGRASGSSSVELKSIADEATFIRLMRAAAASGGVTHVIFDDSHREGQPRPTARIERLVHELERGLG